MYSNSEEDQIRVFFLNSKQKVMKSSVIKQELNH